ncbi:hypothetical protein AgCh_026053 [Apium graveolens]
MNLEGISDIPDESDRSGMRVVIELKRGSDPSIVLNNLYRLTALQSGFSCNMVGLLELKQDKMTVAEYEAKFTELSRFVPEFVNTEEKKA